IGDINLRRITQLQVFEGTTIDVHRRLDTHTDLTGVVVDVIALCRVLVWRAGVASLDGHGRIIAQGHDQVVVQRLVDVHGEGRFDVLGHRGLVSGDGHQYQIAFVASAWRTRTRF
ncbi:hypothetical protein IOK26_24910, partial [Escherichia coli]